MVSMDAATDEQLVTLQLEAEQTYKNLATRGLSLDLTRGKPCPDQLSLSTALDGILAGDYRGADGADLRNYGTPEGIPEARALFGQILDTSPENTLAGGASSLTMMYQLVAYEHCHGQQGAGSSWQDECPDGQQISFLCPVPGYDRHFAICEHLGINMIPVPMTPTGPDMDIVEAAVQSNPMIKGIWCVPRFSNPTGAVYSEETVARMAALPGLAGLNFRVFWDNAYAVHALYEDAPRLASIAACSRELGLENGTWLIGSTSKMTLPGAGVAFVGSGATNIQGFLTHMGYQSIGPDKLNQRRHVLFLKDHETINQHMARHAAVLRPRFEAVESALQNGLGGSGMASWTSPQGGYFVSVDTLSGLAPEIINLATEIGVSLTPAGSTFPYGKDPQQKNIRLAPTFASVDQVKQAMEVFVVCVKLASLRREISHRHPGE